MGSLMPHTKNKSRSTTQFKPNQFVNINIEEGVRQVIKAASFDIDKFDESLNALFMDGYKLSLRYDEKNDCFAAWLIGAPGGENEGYTLAGRGSTPSKAVKQVLYIHIVMLEKVWVEGGDMVRGQIDD